MEKRDVMEIRKTLKSDRVCIDRLYACYVDTEKNLTKIEPKTFLKLPDEELLKYLEIFKKGLGGSIGKSLFNIEFPLEEEEEGGVQASLYALLKKTEQSFDAFAGKIAEACPILESYCILLAHGNYDVPVKGGDSEEVYEHILCCICPATLDKAALCYEKDDIRDMVRAKKLNTPVCAFLYPAFNDRGTDIHAALYHAKKFNDNDAAFLEQFFHFSGAMPVETQTEAVKSAISAAFSGRVTFNEARDVLSNLDDASGEGERMLKKEDIVTAVAEAGDGIGKEELKKAGTAFENIAGKDAEISSECISGGCVELKGEGVLLRLKGDARDTVRERNVDGRRCIVIPVEAGMTVNGLDI